MSDTTHLRQPAQTEATRATEALLPPVDVIEDGAGITLYADLPGVSRDRLHLHVEADTLTIEGEIALPAPEGLESIHSEAGLSVYRRVFTLSKELDATRVGAEFKNGVLKLSIPKAEHAQPRKVEIKVV